MRKNNSNIFSVVLILMLVAVMAGALFLVGQNQEDRGMAYFSGAKLMVQPDDISANVGDAVPVKLFVQTDKITGSAEDAKVSSVDAELCYGEGLSLEAGVDVSSLITLNHEAFKVIEYAKNNNGCLRMVVVSSGIEPANLKSGLVEVASVRFKAVAVGEGEITIDQNKAVVAGYNPNSDATDTTMKIGSVEGAVYTINDSGIEPPGTYSRGDCNSATGKYSCQLDTNGQYGSLSECENSTGCDIATTKYLKGNCNSETGKFMCTTSPNGTYTSLSSCEDATGCEIDTTPVSYYSQVSCNGATGKFSCEEDENGDFESLSECQNATGCDVATGDYPWLKFRMAFLGLTWTSECADAVNMPLTVIVRANDGTSKVYEDVVPTKVENEGGLAFYDVSLKLTGFNYRQGLAVFVKGPKHLQGKYGVNNQSDYYNKAGGELGGLTSDEATTPIFHFEKYPLLAGDVTGPDGEQDGQVDGIDFSTVKKEAIKRTAVSSGDYMLEDLNSNCQMESQDVALLMLSLAVKQGQLY